MVTEVLKLAQLIDEHRMTKMQIGRRGIETRLDTQGFTASQTRRELAFYEDLLGTASDTVQSLLHAVAVRANQSAREGSTAHVRHRRGGNTLTRPCVSDIVR